MGLFVYVLVRYGVKVFFFVKEDMVVVLDFCRGVFFGFEVVVG